jgi:hypothetical protein
MFLRNFGTSTRLYGVFVGHFMICQHVDHYVYEVYMPYLNSLRPGNLKYDHMIRKRHAVGVETKRVPSYTLGWMEVNGQLHVPAALL